MVAFHGVATLDELDSMLQSYKSKGWETSETESILLVNDQCRVVTRFFSGKSYLAGAFATKVPTIIEKIGRVVLGLLATLISCGWALCFQGVRDLFGAHVQKICFAVFEKDSGPDKTLCGVEKSIITAFKVERTCRRGRCDISCCQLEHEDLHSCEIVLKNGKAYNIQLYDNAIRDFLEWLDPRLVEADYTHFAHAGEIKI